VKCYKGKEVLDTELHRGTKIKMAWPGLEGEGPNEHDSGMGRKQRSLKGEKPSYGESRGGVSVGLCFKGLGKGVTKIRKGGGGRGHLTQKS